MITKKTCYQCEQETTYLFPDGRCKHCTRLTPEEIEGHIPTNHDYEFTYDDWHQLWSAVHDRVEYFTDQMERFKNDDDMKLWAHFLEQAENQDALLKKIEKAANEHFPEITKTASKEPNRCTQESATSAEKDAH